MERIQLRYGAIVSGFGVEGLEAKDGVAMNSAGDYTSIGKAQGNHADARNTCPVQAGDVYGGEADVREIKRLEEYASRAGYQLGEGRECVELKGVSVEPLTEHKDNSLAFRCFGEAPANLRRLGTTNNSSVKRRSLMSPSATRMARWRT
jgi:hypothetical protein